FSRQGYWSRDQIPCCRGRRYQCEPCPWREMWVEVESRILARPGGAARDVAMNVKRTRNRLPGAPRRWRNSAPCAACQPAGWLGGRLGGFVKEGGIDVGEALEFLALDLCIDETLDRTRVAHIVLRDQ